MSSVQALSRQAAVTSPAAASVPHACSEHAPAGHKPAGHPSPYPASWHSICSRTDLVAYSGVVAWFAGAQVALFYLPDSTGGKIHAVHNHDPLSGANVIGRGILGQLQGAVVVASPLYKQHFRLEDGGCLEKPEIALTVWPARLNGDRVEIFAEDRTAECS